MDIVGWPHGDIDAALRARADSDCKYDARLAQLLLDFVEALRREKAGPRLFASIHLNRELWLRYRAPNGTGCRITVTMDRPDYGPLEDGLPQFHYRMSYRIITPTDNLNHPLTEERARRVQSAVEFVWQAISEARELL